MWNSVVSVLNLCPFTLLYGMVGRVMVLGIFQCRSVLLIWITVGQGPAVLAEGARWYCFHAYYMRFLSPSLWKTVVVRY